MLPQNKPDRIRILFDDQRLVANAGLLLPATLARHLGLRELVDHHLDLGGAPGRANTGDKMLALVASALAGGDCIDAADALRAGGTVGVLGCVVKAPSTLGTFLRSFRWGHVRQLDRVSRQLLARAWAAGAGPGDSPLTIDLDSTICETYGLAKEGARHHGYTGARGYHPLLAIAAGTGEVLMSRLREGRANTARGAALFLRETVGRVRYGGARGQLTVRADSGFYAHTVVAACREMDVRFSITIRQRASLRDLIEAIPEEDWTPIPYWMDAAADVAETTYTPFQTKPDAAPVRLIVRRVKPTPGSQTEWPLGANLQEAEELAQVAADKGVKTLVGLQGRCHPTYLRARELIEAGYVGEVISANLTQFGSGILARGSDRTWQRDKTLGANTLTISFGHVIDALCTCLGEFSEVSALVSTRVPQWQETDTGRTVDVTSPDNVLVTGMLTSGAVVSAHVGSVPWLGSDFRLEVYGREGTLVMGAAEHPQLGGLKLRGGHGSDSELLELPIPDRLKWVPDSVQAGAPFNVAQMWSRFADAIRTGERVEPDFDSAVARHRLLDAIERASDTGQRQVV